MVALDKIDRIENELKSFISLLLQAEDLLNSSPFLIRIKAQNIIDNSVAQYKSDPTPENIRWVQDSVINFLRFFPENIVSCGNDEIDMSINKVYYTLNELINI